MAEQPNVPNGGPKRIQPDQLEDAIRSTLKKGKETKALLANLQELQRGDLLSFTHGLDVRAELITGDDHADELYQRHKALNRAGDIVAAARTFYESGDATPLDAVREKLKRLGGFLQEYSLEKICERLHSDNWVIAHSEGSILNKDNLQKGESRFAADIQVHIPDDKKDAELGFVLPDLQNGDTFWRDTEGQRIADEIHANHAIGGCVSDICAEDEVAHYGFASQAREAAFREIFHRNNARHNPVRYVIAETFEITGVELSGGEKVPVSPTMGNVVSLLIHLHSKKYPALLGWTRVNDKVPVYLEGEDASNQSPHHIVTDWRVLVHDLSEQQS